LSPIEFIASRPDGRPDWRVVFDLTETMKPDQIVTHEDLCRELGADDMQRVYRAVNRANKQLWKTRHKSLDTIRGVGYRVLRASEHEGKATRYQKRARRQIGNAVAVIEATDLSELNNQDRDWNLKVQTGLKLLAGALDAQAAKVAEHDAAIARLVQRVEDLESR
jgi:hypothetical protein